MQMPATIKEMLPVYKGVPQKLHPPLPGLRSRDMGANSSFVEGSGRGELTVNLQAMPTRTWPTL